MFFNGTAELKVLALGAHPDDVEIGAGGFLSKIQRSFDAEIHFGIMTYGRSYAKDKRTDEATRAIKVLLGYSDEEINDRIHFGYQKDCALHHKGHELIKVIEQWLEEIKPDLILTHSLGDLHDDHRQVFYATISAARNFHGEILFYQSPSTIISEFSPNFYVEIPEDDYKRKIDAISTHSSQEGKEFMGQDYSDRVSQAWGVFHKLPIKKKYEAFKMYQSFFLS